MHECTRVKDGKHSNVQERLHSCIHVHAYARKTMQTYTQELHRNAQLQCGHCSVKEVTVFSVNRTGYLDRAHDAG